MLARDLLVAIIIGGVVGGLLLVARIRPQFALATGLVTFLVAFGGLVIFSTY